MTGRGTSASFDAAIEAGTIRKLIMLKLAFSTGVLRLNNSSQHFVWDGATWYGLGTLGSLSGIDEGFDLQSRQIKVKLSGLDASLMAKVLSTHYRNRNCVVYIAPLDEQYRLIDSPVAVWVGRMDTIDFDRTEDSSTFTLTASSRLADWDRPRIRRYSDADQQIAYPGDRGLEFVAAMVEKEVTWGR